MWTRGFATLLALIPLALAQQSEWGQCKTKAYIHQFWNEILKLIVKVVVLDGLERPHVYQEPSVQLLTVTIHNVFPELLVRLLRPQLHLQVAPAQPLALVPLAPV